jgi:outer membrane immunogenic protein
MKKFLLATAALGTLALPAMAADMAPAPYYKAPIPVPVCIWCGFYFGGNIGGKWADTSDSVFMAATSGLGGTTPAGVLPFGSTTTGTFMGGGQVGYNWQVGTIVYGIEGDVDAHHWNTFHAAGPFPLPGEFVPGDSFTASSDWQASLRGRLGYTWDRALLYVTGGVAWTRVSVGTNFIASGGFPAALAIDSAILTGGTFGGGLEYAVTNAVSLGVEGRYTWYGSHTYNGGTVAAFGFPPAGPFVYAPASQNLSLNTAEVLGKINIKLGPWGPFGLLC